MKPASNTPREKFVGELRFGKELTGVIQLVGVGLNISLGLVVLYTSLVIPQVRGPIGLITLGAGLAVGLTLLSVIELLGGGEDWGGTYQLVYEILHRGISFLTGWGILFGSLALAAGLALLAAGLLDSVLQIGAPVPLIALGLLAFLLLVQLFQFLPRRIQGWVFAGVVSALFLAAVFTLEPAGVLESFQRAAISRPASFLSGEVALLCGSYVIFEALLSVRRQTRKPSALLPPGVVYTFILWLGLTTLGFVGAGREESGTERGSPFLASLVERSSLLPEWLGGLLILSLLLVGTSGVIMVAARQISSLSRTGGLPTWLRQVRRPFPLPLYSFLAMGCVLVPLTALGTVEFLAFIGAAIFLAVMIMLNIAAIRSRRAEPNRRRIITLPFAPLIPAIAIAINLVYLRYIPLPSLLTAALIIAAGLAVYLLYSRRRLAEAKVESTTFGLPQEMEENEAYYRILVPIGPGVERHFVLNTAITLARQARGEVLPLQVITMADPLAVEEGRRTAKERNTLFTWSIRKAQSLDVPVFPITRLSRSVHEGILDTAEEEDCNLILLPWVIRGDFQRARIGQSIGQVVRKASCDIAVLAYHPESIQEDQGDGRTAANGGDQSPDDGRKSGVPFKRILVPTSGGPNAPLAVQIASMLALDRDVRVEAIYVTNPGASDEELALGRQRIKSSIESMVELAEAMENGRGFTEYRHVSIEGDVIQAESIIQGIAEAGGGRDLILLGMSEESLIDQVLFGTIPEQVAATSSSPVMLVKRYRGLPRLWLNRILQSLYRSLPKLTPEEQIEVYRAIHKSARPSIDYFIMIGLSATIATFGLFLNSSAVIIGAMLVAPLFSPIIGLGLSTTLGNIRLLRLAIEATLKGIALAIGLALLFTILGRSGSLPDEVLSRTQPSLLDMAVALASGAAGAYAMARKDVATALPGVAIAAALVPPLCVVGIGIAYGDLLVTLGSSLLFLTNLVSIVLAGSVVFLLLGFRPGGEQVREYHFQRALSVTVTLFILILIPLGFFFYQSIQTVSLEGRVDSVVSETLEAYPDLEMAPSQETLIDQSGEAVLVTVSILSQGASVDDFVDSLSQELEDAVDQPVRVRVLAIPVVESP